VIKITKHGRGVFADRPFIKNELVESCECLYLASQDLLPNHPILFYAYWINEKTVALALGNGSLYNHNPKPNLVFDHQDNKINFRALILLRKTKN